MIAEKYNVNPSELNDEQMLDVFKLIIEKSGTSNKYVNWQALGSGLFTSAMVVVVFSAMVYDITMAEHPEATAAIDVSTLLASIGAGEAYEELAVPLLEAGMLEAGASESSVYLATFIFGSVGGLVVGSLVVTGIAALSEFIVNALSGNPIPVNLRRDLVVAPSNSAYDLMLKQWLKSTH